MSIRHKLYILLLRSLPNALWPLRKLIIKKSLKHCGKSVKLGPNVFILNPHLVTIGDNVFIGDKSTISGNVHIDIGNDVLFGPEVMIRGGDHNINYVGKHMRFVKSGGKNMPVTIEDDVWIGTRAIILKGVKIGEGAVVGAGAIITRDIPPYTVNVGNPSKPIKLRFNKDDLQKHIELVKSKYKYVEIISMFENAKD